MVSKQRLWQIRNKNNRKKEIARGTIKDEIRRGKRPSAKTLKCFDCGKQAQSYDHYKGYAKRYRRFVQPVCNKCHSERTKKRNEQKVTKLQSAS